MNKFGCLGLFVFALISKNPTSALQCTSLLRLRGDSGDETNLETSLECPESNVCFRSDFIITRTGQASSKSKSVFW